MARVDVDTARFKQMVEALERALSRRDGQKPSKRSLAGMLGLSYEQLTDCCNGRQSTFNGPDVPNRVLQAVTGIPGISTDGLFMHLTDEPSRPLAQSRSGAIKAAYDPVMDPKNRTAMVMNDAFRGIKPRHIRCQLTMDALAPLPVELEAEVERQWPLAVIEARRQNRLLHDDYIFSLRNCFPPRQSTGTDSKRRHEADLEVLQCSYRRWYYPNKCFDKPVTQDVPRTWAEVLNFDRSPLTCDSLRNFPWLAVRLGVGLTLLGSDNRVIVPIRSTMVSEGDHGTYSCSVGETVCGADRMKAVADLLHLDLTAAELDLPSPVAAVVRALEWELGVLPGLHYDPNEMRLLAITLSRDDVCSSLYFFLQANCTSEKIVNAWRFGPRASDRMENKDILTPKWSKRTVTGLVNGWYSHAQGPGRKTQAYKAAHAREQIGFHYARQHRPPS